MKFRSCKCASFDEDLGRYICSITDSECMYYVPDSKQCAEDYGEGSDADEDENERTASQNHFTKRLKTAAKNKRCGMVRHLPTT